MKLLMLIAICLVIVTISLTAQPKPKLVPPANRRAIHACGVTIYAPLDMKEEKVHPIDSCVVQYRNDKTLLVLDSIMYSAPGTSRKDEYSDKRDFSLRKLNVGGRRAEIISCFETELSPNYKGLNYSAVLYVPELPKARGNLTIWTYSRSSDARDLAVKMLESVQFAK